MITTVSDYVDTNKSVCERIAERNGIKISYHIVLDWLEDKKAYMNIDKIDNNGVIYGVDIADKIEQHCSKLLDDSFTMEICDSVIVFEKALTIDECIKLELEEQNLENGIECTQESGTYFMDDMLWSMEENTVCAIIDDWNELNT